MGDDALSVHWRDDCICVTREYVSVCPTNAGRIGESMGVVVGRTITCEYFNLPPL